VLTIGVRVVVFAFGCRVVALSLSLGFRRVRSSVAAKLKPLAIYDGSRFGARRHGKRANFGRVF